MVSSFLAFLMSVFMLMSAAPPAIDYYPVVENNKSSGSNVLVFSDEGCSGMTEIVRPGQDNRHTTLVDPKSFMTFNEVYISVVEYHPGGNVRAKVHPIEIHSVSNCWAVTSMNFVYTVTDQHKT